MNNLYARSVFFVNDAERALRFYTDTLGFTLDWKYDEQDRPYVFQVSLLGFELIVNQTGPATTARAGHGRVFIGLDDDQVARFREHIKENAIDTEGVDWGRPTPVLRDLGTHEFFIWPAHGHHRG